MMLQEVASTSAEMRWRDTLTMDLTGSGGIHATYEEVFARLMLESCGAVVCGSDRLWMSARFVDASSFVAGDHSLGALSRTPRQSLRQEHRALALWMFRTGLKRWQQRQHS